MESSPSSHSRCLLGESEREMLTGSSSSRKVFDAFISHRGPDVKGTVAFALCEALEEKGYWTFLDENKLQLGDSIESSIKDAIYSSRVQIAIFSPRYAESPWCLDELLLMLETKTRFVPIFCDVMPFELRCPDKGVSPYSAAFTAHERKGRISEEKINQWKSALMSCADKSGYIFSTSNGNVEMLCATIVSAVQKEVGKRNSTERLHGDEAASTSTTSCLLPKRSSLQPRDSHPVGIDSKVELIKRLLEDPQVPVIAVVGMGGSGKTFLLQNVYESVKSKYGCSIWLSISKSYLLKDLQHDIASHTDLTSEIVNVTEVRAAELIHQHLKGKTSFIVLDDLWELSTEVNLLTELGLPDDKNCKIVITTRNKKVAEISHARIYEMKNLSEEDSWRLFCIHAFPHSVGNRAPRQLEEEGRKIVKQCGNLPLAIKTIAASLANTRLLSKWDLKRRQLERVVNPIGDPDRLAVIEILKVSYDSLPRQLKACFSYLSFFSEDENINAEYLIYLWIAEGIIPAGEEQWDMAWDLLDQLVQLCLVQLYENHMGNLDERRYLYKYCKIHDLLYDLAIQISKENKCVFSVEEVSSHTSGATPGWHRILLAKKSLHNLAMPENRPLYLRTLSLSQNWGIRSIPENLFTAIRGLRVLDLSYTRISTLPASLGKMVLLRVLNLRGTGINVVPKCVKYLKSLFFLALCRKTYEIPEWISEFERLEYFECYDINRMSKRILKLRSLKRLRLVFGLRLSIEEEGFMLDDLVKMTQLQEVSFCLGHEIDLKRTEEGILAQLVNMRHLKISNYVTKLGQFSEKMRAMKHLEYLRLYGFVVPGWICQVENLRELYLRESEMERMPKEFGKSGAFPQLRIFHISCFRSLEEFPELEEGAMPLLQRFQVWGCCKLKKVEGLERLKMLKELDFTGSRDRFSETLKEGREYWKKIKAVNPHVIIRTT